MAWSLFVSSKLQGNSNQNMIFICDSAFENLSTAAILFRQQYINCYVNLHFTKIVIVQWFGLSGVLDVITRSWNSRWWATLKLSNETEVITLVLYSGSGKTSYRQILWILKAARFGVIMIISLWILMGFSVVLLSNCLWNDGAIASV